MCRSKLTNKFFLTRISFSRSKSAFFQQKRVRTSQFHLEFSHILSFLDIGAVYVMHIVTLFGFYIHIVLFSIRLLRIEKRTTVSIFFSSAKTSLCSSAKSTKTSFYIFHVKKYQQKLFDYH